MNQRENGKYPAVDVKPKKNTPGQFRALKIHFTYLSLQSKRNFTATPVTASNTIPPIEVKKTLP